MAIADGVELLERPDWIGLQRIAHGVELDTRIIKSLRGAGGPGNSQTRQAQQQMTAMIAAQAIAMFR
jgi:hypothetical protein